MSRRSRRRAEPTAGTEGRRADSTAGTGGRRAEPRSGAARAILRDVAILAAVFGVAVGVAELAGAANLGVSFGIGQVCFALALIVLLTRE